jgi:soluble lytic murein transglycosylase-like protein
LGTTRPDGSPRGAAFRRALSAATCALMLAGAVSPAGSQEGGRRRLLGVRVDSVQTAQRRTGGFWAWVLEEARRVRELNGGPLAFAMRYRIPTDQARQIHDVARAEGIDPELGFRLVRVESGFNPQARSRVGALGLTQLMPATARWLERGVTRQAILEPERNLRIGFRYLRSLIAKYDGDLQLALLAYNRGDGAVDRDLRRGRNPENGYSRAVLGTGVQRYSGTGLLPQR